MQQQQQQQQQPSAGSAAAESGTARCRPILARYICRRQLCRSPGRRLRFSATGLSPVKRQRPDRPQLEQAPETEPVAAPEPLIQQDPEPVPEAAMVMEAVMKPATPLRRPVAELVRELMDKLQQRQAQDASEQDDDLLAEACGVTIQLLDLEQEAAPQLPPSSPPPPPPPQLPPSSPPPPPPPQLPTSSSPSPPPPPQLPPSSTPLQTEPQPEPVPDGYGKQIHCR